MAERGRNAIVHPITLLAIVVLVLNDHVLKSAYGNQVTGKLSDICGLIVAPLVLASILERRSPRAIEWSLTAIGIGFASINTIPLADAIYEGVLGTVIPSTNTRDAGDLLTLPALLVAWWVWRRPRRSLAATGKLFGRLAFAAAVLACTATSEGGVATDTTTGVLLLDQEHPRAEFSVRVELDGAKIPASDAVEVDVRATTFTGADEAAPVVDIVRIETLDGAPDGHDTIRLVLAEPSHSPAHVEWSMRAVSDEGDDLTLEIDPPPDRSFALVGSREIVPSPNPRIQVNEWMVAGVEADTSLFLLVPASRTHTVDYRIEAATTDARYPLVPGQGRRIDVPEGCRVPCSFSLWTSAVRRDLPVGAEMQLLALDEDDLTVEVLDRELARRDLRVASPAAEVDGSVVGTHRFLLDVSAPSALTPIEEITTFLNTRVRPASDITPPNALRPTGSGVKRLDECCPITIFVAVRPGDTAPISELSMVGTVEFFSLDPVDPAEVGATVLYGGS